MDRLGIKIPKLRGSTVFFSWFLLVQELMTRDSVEFVLIEPGPDSPISAKHK